MYHYALMKSSARQLNCSSHHVSHHHFNYGHLLCNRTQTLWEKMLYFVLLCTPQVDRKEMRFSSLTFDDSGIYQCIAENRHGVIYASAELRVFGESNNYHNTHGCVTFHAN